MTIPEALKQLYTAIGGTASDVADCTLTVEVLNKFAAYLEGDSNATQNVEAIMNIVAVAGNLIPDPTLIDKNITANGTYNASSDNVQGYSKVVVDVGQLNTIKYVEGESFATASKLFEKISVPEGYLSLYYDSTYRTSLASAVNLKELYLPSTIRQDGISSTMFSQCTALEKITINKPEGSIGGAPWGAPASCQIVWRG